MRNEQKPSSNTPKIFVAIPCFNTERFIGDVVSRTKRYVHSVIVVNDGSSDGTARAAEAAGALVVSHEVNKGYGEAIKTCFEAARANGADILVTLDGDGQHNPDELPGVLAPILNGEADLVIGSRLVRNGKVSADEDLRPLKNEDRQGKDMATYTMPPYRKVGIEVITFLYNIGAGEWIRDAQSGFRAYRRSVLDAVVLKEKGMGVSVEALIKARANHFVIREAHISCKYHSQSSTMNPIIHGLGVALDVVRLRLSAKH